MVFKILIFCCVIFLANAQIANTTLGKSCNVILAELAHAQSIFVRCVTVHSVPVRMCNGCKLQYYDMLKTYDMLVNSCNSEYFDKDRINLVPSTESVLTGLWTKAYCDDCFNYNNTFKFENLTTKFEGCLLNNHNTPCESCKNEYQKLNNFYISLDKHNNGEVCFDIQDGMNRTRYEWSKVLKCCVRKYNILYFSISLSIATFVTLMFYCSTYLLTKRQERNHGTLNDQDPLFNSPSSSAQVNILSNRRQIIIRSPANNQGNNVSVSAETTQKKEKLKVSKNYDKCDSSDEDPIINNSTAAAVKDKLKQKVSKNYDKCESSDDEPIINNSTAAAVKKLK